MSLGHGPQSVFDLESFVVPFIIIKLIQNEGLRAVFDLSMTREQAGYEEVLARCCSLSVSDSLGKLTKGAPDCLFGELFGVEVDNVLFFQAKLE